MNTAVRCRWLLLTTCAVVLAASCASATEARRQAQAVRNAPAATAAARACVDGVAAELDDARADTDLVAPGSPLDLGALAGRTIWYVTVTFNQFSSDWVAGLQEAAAEAGVKIVTFDGQGQVTRFNEGIAQAVAQRADGIIVAAIEPATVQGALAEAAAAGIPVMNGFNSDPTEPLPTAAYTNFTSDFTADGAAAARYALHDSGCSAHLVVLSSSAVRVWDNVATGARSVFEEHCPAECTLEVIDVDIANVATDIGTQLSAALLRDPGVTHVLAAGDSLVSFVDPVLASTGSGARVLGRDGLAASIERVAGQDGQAMTLAMPPFGWLGWLAFDSMARAILRMPDPGYVVPARVVDLADVGDGSADALFPRFVGYRQAFRTAWAGPGPR